MKVGDRVFRDSVLHEKNVEGTIHKITTKYTIVIWDNINGEWHYTHDQAQLLKHDGKK